MQDLYTVILVDDEDDVRGRVISKIKEESGFKVIGKAGNGYDALELIEELKPDVVITDIKMPFINGIELAKILRRDYPTIKLGFISGYDEFEYAKEAIELNVISYIMKPITTKDLNKFLSKLKKLLDEEKDQINNISNLKEVYNKSLPKLIESNLFAFSNLSILEDSNIELLKELNFNCDLSTYLVATIGFKDSIDLTSEQVLSIKSIIDRAFIKYDLVSSFRNHEGVSFIIGYNDQFQVKDNDLYLFEIAEYIEEFLKIKTTIGISSRFSNLKYFPKAFIESVKSKDHGKYYNLGSVIYYTDIADKKVIDPDIDKSLYEEFDYAIKFADEKELDTLFSKFIKKLESTEGYIINHEVLIVDIASRLMKLSSIGTSDASYVFGENLLSKLASFNSSKELFKWIKDTVLKIRKINSKKQIDKVEKLVIDTFKMIDENYHDSYLSLDGVASKLNISVSYLSSIIKKYKNITFNKYLIQVRMEKAKELLKFTNEKILNISKQVGYNEVYYFSHSFKKYTGLTPGSYREENKDI